MARAPRSRISFGSNERCGGVVLDNRDHLFHPVSDLAHLRMYFLDQIVFRLGTLFDAFSLFFKLIQ